MLAVELPKQSNKSYKEPQQADGQGSMAIDTFGSSLFGDWIYLAENLRRPAAQHVLGHKVFIGARRPESRETHGSPSGAIKVTFL